jgi:hypothetical protein
MTQAEISKLQSRRSHNAAVITLLISKMLTAKAEANVSCYRLSREYHRDEARRIRTAVIEMSNVQKQVKKDLLASKYARLQAAGKVRSKHGMDDPRYEAWADRPVEFRGVQL